MKYISIGLIFLLVVEISPFSVAFAEENEKVIIISEKVGEVIDVEERDRYTLFPQIEGFKSAVFLQLSDGSFVAEVTYEEDGVKKKERILQSEMAIESLKNYIEKVSEGKIQSFSLTDEVRTAGKLVSISEKVGVSIDKAERSEYELFMNIPNFERATFYSLKEGGYLIEIQTQTDTLISVVRDTATVSILSDYVGRYEEVKADRESFERKWSIIYYDGQGIPITENEILRYHKKGSCWTSGCALGGGATGFVFAALAAGFANMAGNENVGPIPVFAAVILGGGAGYFIGNRIDKGNIDRYGIVFEIKISRTPK